LGKDNDFQKNRELIFSPQYHSWARRLLFISVKLYDLRGLEVGQTKITFYNIVRGRWRIIAYPFVYQLNPVAP
jgi:hypothetical protein